MISTVKIVTVCVGDQDRALDFYTNKLGFEVRQDVPFGSFRWLQVAPPGAETSLVLFTPPGMQDRIGQSTGIVFTAEDVRKSYQELIERGVQFIEPPTEQPWGGVQAQFVDQDGNRFVLHS